MQWKVNVMNILDWEQSIENFILVYAPPQT